MSARSRSITFLMPRSWHCFVMSPPKIPSAVRKTSTVRLRRKQDHVPSRGGICLPTWIAQSDGRPAGQDSVLAAAAHARQSQDRYLCDISCFSCGPDAMVHHRLHHEMEGRPFCFLEIDSHTAHAGIETRVGAFLDIIEARRRQAVPVRPAAKSAVPAHLEQANGRTCVVTGAGRRLALDAPEVVHVSLSDGPRFLCDMVARYNRHPRARIYSAVGHGRLRPLFRRTLEYLDLMARGENLLPDRRQAFPPCGTHRHRPPAAQVVRSRHALGGSHHDYRLDIVAA